jgi:hypothetical protein
MGTTPNGIPWPEPTEMVRNGAADMQELAAYIDGTLLRAGNYDGLTDGNGIATVALDPLPKSFVAIQAGDWPASAPWVNDQFLTIAAIQSGTVYVKVFFLSTRQLYTNGRVLFNWIAFGAR